MPILVVPTISCEVEVIQHQHVSIQAAFIAGLGGELRQRFNPRYFVAAITKTLYVLSKRRFLGDNTTSIVEKPPGLPNFFL